MKVNQVGDSANVLLWPQNLINSSGESSDAVKAKELLLPTTKYDSFALLWPAALINRQARLGKQKNFLSPLAILSFILSFIFGLIVGPLLIVMIALSNNYTWATTIFYNNTLHWVLPLTSVLAILNLVILVWLFMKPILQQRTILTLVLGSLVEIGLIWAGGYYLNLAPPQLMLFLLAVPIVFFVITLFVSKQYVAKPELSIMTKIVSIVLILVAITEILLGGFYIINNNDGEDSSEIEQLTALQAAARIEGIPNELSDLVFAVCGNGRYQVVYMSEVTLAGLFECVSSGEVYSVAVSDNVAPDTITGAATYLGTTKDKTISVAFPNSYYLYRSLPQVLSEDELAIMYPASTEQELIDNLAPMLLSYWQEHSGHNLYLNVFYNPNLEQVTETRDYILMSALGTMVKVEGLPRGLTVQGVSANAKANYLFHFDSQLDALNELGSMPELYASSTREALMTYRHISIHLAAEEPLDYDTIVTRLWESWTGGLE